jgi:carbonic anhydrase/acetyltransferase-like protein (isoleucine patch superfamily)
MNFKPIKYKSILPNISNKALVAPNAIITGDTEISDYSNIWYNVVIRGDVAPIRIGKNTNIQDGSIIHVSRPYHPQNKTGSDGAPTIIGDYVTIGHMAMIHACIIDSYSFIGMSSVIMDMAHIESEAMVAAGAIITPGKIVKRGEIWAGNPGKFLRKMSESEINYISKSAKNYVELAAEYFS